MKKHRICLTERGESVVTSTHLLALIQDTIVQGHNMGDAGCAMYAYLCGAINSLGALGYVEVRENAPPPAGTGPDPRSPNPPSFFLDAYRDMNKKEDGDAPQESDG